MNPITAKVEAMGAAVKTGKLGAASYLLKVSSVNFKERERLTIHDVRLNWIKHCREIENMNGAAFPKQMEHCPIDKMSVAIIERARETHQDVMRLT